MPALNESTIRVRNLEALTRAFALAGRETNKELRERLKKVAEPVRAQAEQFAGQRIRNLHAGDPWSQMRARVTRSLVYVAPKERGRRSRSRPSIRRPNLAPLLMDRAMQPALEQKAPLVQREFEDMLDAIGSTWEHA